MPQPDRVLAELGRTLRAARIDRGLSQEQLSIESGVHRNYIGGIERGERNPTVTKVAELAEALGVPVAELLREP